MRDTQPLQAALVAEAAARVSARSEASVPEPCGSYAYYSKLPAGADLSLYCRRPLDEEGGAEQTVLDLNKHRGPEGYVGLLTLRFSADHSCAAVALETHADGRSEGRVLQLPSGQLCGRPLPGALTVEFDATGTSVLYVTADAEGRPAVVRRRSLPVAEVAAPIAEAPRWVRGFAAAECGRDEEEEEKEDAVFHEEADPAFFLDVSRTKDFCWLLIGAYSKAAAEVWLMNARAHASVAALTCICPKSAGVHYFVEHHEGYLYILADRGPDGDQGVETEPRPPGGGEYALFRAPAATPGRDHWQPVLPPRADVSIEDMDLFKGHLVLYEREKDGLPAVSVLPLPLGDALPDPSRLWRAPLPTWAASIAAGANAEFAADHVRLNLSSPIHDERAYDLHLIDRTLICMEPEAELRDAAPGSDARLYELLREEATSADGISVPLTLARRREAIAACACVPESPLEVDGSALPTPPPRGAGHPVLMHVYGAYGLPLTLDYDPSLLPMLQRGWTLAWAHVRGGGERGRSWHMAATGDFKVRSMEDMEACVAHLRRQGYGPIAARAVSAGGLVLGAVLNRTGNRALDAAVARVPWVDPLTEMLSKPEASLTQHEQDEWGPVGTCAAATAAVRAYAPYQNVRPQAYPAILATAALHDRRVPYWGAAKWVAALRAERTNKKLHGAGSRPAAGEQGAALAPADCDAWTSQPPILLSVSESDGHFGRGGVRGPLEAAAFEHAFLIHATGQQGK